VNLAEAIGAALPELTATRIPRKNAPRVDPNLIVRDDLDDREPIVAVYQRGSANFFRFTPAQWQLVSLFDGRRTYEEIADAFSVETGSELSADDVREFAEGLNESNFWYKTPQEKNLALSEKLAASRARRAKRKSRFNLTHMLFSAWDPDRFLTIVDRKIGKIVYSQWFTAATIALFLFTAAVFIVKWSDIGHDTLTYYNFSKKTALDLAEFWILFLIMGFFHESAHGLSCKHYGGEVHSMGLQLLYLTPAFFVDVTETWVSGTRAQRIATILAGIWVETMACGIATVVWWNTPPGDWLHDFAYKIMLITGVAVIVVNLNPLIKLDGYYAFTEIIGIADIKERSTEFLTTWVQRNLRRLRVEVPVVPRRRVMLFTIYAFVSGLYSYLLLFAVIRFSYNVFANWWHQIALLPAAGLAFLMFRGRLRSLGKVLRSVYKSHIGERRTRFVLAGIFAAAALAAVFVLPLWRESVFANLQSCRACALRVPPPRRARRCRASAR
jgi:putative peptide zinc metalloprotease protein